MQRYTVTIVIADTTQQLQLLVPILDTLPVSTLGQEIKRRSAKYPLYALHGDVLLHLHSESGPILDDDDLLEDVVPDPDNAKLFAVSPGEATSATSDSPEGWVSVAGEPDHAQNAKLAFNTKESTTGARADDNGFRIRVITPALASAFEDHNFIPLFQGGIPVPGTTTIWDLRCKIANTLGGNLNEESYATHQECNCAFARQIQKQGVWEKLQCSAVSNASTHSCSFLIEDGRDVGYATCAICKLSLSDSGSEKKNDTICGSLRPAMAFIQTNTACQHALHQHCVNEQGPWSCPLTCWDGALLNHDQASTSPSSTLSFIVVHGHSHVDILHAQRPDKQSIQSTLEERYGKVLENTQVVQFIGGHETNTEYTIMPVIAVCSRQCHTSPSKNGKSPIHPNNGYIEEPSRLMDLDLHTFEGPIGTADRNLNLTEAGLEDCTVNGVLDLFVVERSSKPDSIQKLGKEAIYRAAEVWANQQSSLNDATTPYLTSIRVTDLTHAGTLQPIIQPIFTSLGLMEKGYFEAYCEGGILSWYEGKRPLSLGSTNTRIRRLVLLSGGTVPEITTIENDLLNRLLRRESSQLSFSRDRTYWDLNGLAGLCEHNGLPVIPPSALSSSEAPALTLDRQCMLSVYVGREACGAPGKDVIMFRPLNGDESVDVSIITQIINPILKIRTGDGTYIFDCYGGSLKRKERNPKEVIFFCVDCSTSMENSSDFEELQESTARGLDENSSEEFHEYNDEDDFDDNVDDTDLDEEDYIIKSDTVVDNCDAPMEDDVGGVESKPYSGLSFAEVKALISGHESFQDWLAIIEKTNSFDRRYYASRIISHLTRLYKRELLSVTKARETLQTWVTSGHFRRRDESKGRIAKLESNIASLTHHIRATCDYLVYRASTNPQELSNWKWVSGDEIPSIEAQGHSDQIFFSDFSTPEEFLCPITQEIFEDPVVAADGVTYERKAIQRWFKIRPSSPTTGLDISDTTLRSNHVLCINIGKWILGENIMGAIPTVQKKPKRSSSPEPTFKIKFLRQEDSFEREVSDQLSVADLISESKLYIQPVSAKMGYKPLDDGNAWGQLVVGPREPRLIRVYCGERQSPKFSFWMPKGTRNSMSLIIFRHWRYMTEKGQPIYDNDVDIWTNMRYNGDNQVVGERKNHWDNLSSMNFRTANVHTNDALYAIDGETDPGTDPEVPAKNMKVLKVSIYQHRSEASVEQDKKKKEKKLSRLDTSKHIFDTFINRVLAYNLTTHIGLIVFNSKAEISQHITYAIEDFRASISCMKAQGDTSIWDALALANDQLSQYMETYPHAKKRIICLSDGLDTKSATLRHDICDDLIRKGVVVDSFCIGNESNLALRAISHFTGGYKFSPTTLEQAMAIAEMEPVLSQLERPDIQRQALNDPKSLSFSSVLGLKTDPDIVTRDVFPERRQHPNLSDAFIDLPILSVSKVPPSLIPGEKSNANVRTARLLAEVRNMASASHPRYEVYVSESNMGFWKIVMQGPPDGPYSQGTFLLYLHMENMYPAFPPKARFCTPIIHPNINKHGLVCHSIFDRNWTADTSNTQLLNTVYSLLLVPEFSDPINAVVTLNYHWDEVAFRDEVEAHIRRHAIKPRDEFRKEILGS